MELSDRAKNLKPSPTLALAAKARELQAKGLDIVSLTVGEPDWGTTPAASEAGIAAIKSDFTKYTAVAGIPELRKAIADQMNRQLSMQFKPENISVGAGAKFVIFSALQVLCNPGDEVIIPAPFWVSYPVMAELAGAKPVIVDCTASEGFKMTAEKFAAAITKKTKALILCGPSNPTGFMYTSQELKALAEVLQKNPHVSVISDDIYNQLLFNDLPCAPHLLQVDPSLVSRCVLVNGASKSYSMTGWRIGWGSAPAQITNAMVDYMSQSTSSVSSISQKAALAAILHGDTSIQEARKNLKVKRDFLFDSFSGNSLFEPTMPDGAFYLWVRIKSTNVSSKDIAKDLLEKYLVATVPGSEFGTEGYLRLSFATSMPNLEKAAARFKKMAADFNSTNPAS